VRPAIREVQNILSGPALDVEYIAGDLSRFLEGNERALRPPDVSRRTAVIGLLEQIHHIRGLPAGVVTVSPPRRSTGADRQTGRSGMVVSSDSRSRADGLLSPLLSHLLSHKTRRIHREKEVRRVN